MTEIDYSPLPAHLREGMQRWIEQGIQPGAFLCAVLTNDLLRAMIRADEVSRAHVYDIVKWLYQNAPEGSYGRFEVLDQWPLFIAAKLRQDKSNA